MERKVALVTGGSRGIGEAIVRKFVKEGFCVCFSYVKSQEKAEKLANELSNGEKRVIAVKADAGNAFEIKQLVKTCTETFGQIDVLVNNAGISESGLLVDMTDEQIVNLLNVNLNSCIITTREVLKEMLKRNYGKIVNISSIWGVSGASCESVYSASKAGIIGFTQGVAKEFGLSNINVNAVAPGVIGTDMLKGYTKQEIQELVDNTALGRIGWPEDIANAVYFLASDEARFITGQCLVVDGGFLQ